MLRRSSTKVEHFDMSLVSFPLSSGPKIKTEKLVLLWDPFRELTSQRSAPLRYIPNLVEVSREG